MADVQVLKHRNLSGLAKATAVTTWQSSGFKMDVLKLGYRTVLAAADYLYLVSNKMCLADGSGLPARELDPPGGRHELVVRPVQELAAHVLVSRDVVGGTERLSSSYHRPALTPDSPRTRT